VLAAYRRRVIKRKATILCSALTAAVLLAACGSNEQLSETSAQETAQTYLLAQKSGDWKTFCALVTTKSQESLQTTLIQSKKGPKPKSCQESIQGATPKTKKALQVAAQGLKISKVEVSEGQALIYAQTPAGTSTLGMVEENGRWFIALVR
jgi:hypothetical protein